MEYVNPWYTQGYTTSAAKGAVGPGGAQFGLGAGGKYRFDYTVQPQANGFAGLWSQGIDYRDKNAATAVMQWYNSQPANVRSEVDSYWKNNKKTGNLAQDMMTAVDWRTRDVARKIQKENGFLDSTFGKLLTGAAQIGLGFVPGVGPALSAGFGAITGGLQGGLGGALLGGLSGYGAGQLGAGLKGAFTGAGGLSTLTKAPGTFFSNVGRNGLTSLQNVVPGYGGSVGSALGSAATSAGGFLSSTASGGSGAAASPGGGMSFFSDLLKGLAPDIIGGGIQYLGAKSAQEDFSKIAQQLQSQSQFNPYNVSGPAGSASFFGNTATANLSPELQAQLGQMDTATRGAFEDYMKFNAGGYADNYYKTISDMRRPTDQAQTNDLLNRVYSTGNWGSTVGAQDVYSYQQAKTLEDAGIKLQAQEAGAQEQDRLFNRYFKSAASTQELATLPYDLINQGGNLGGTASTSAVNASQYPWLAEQSSVAASANFWKTIGGSVGKTASDVLGKYAGYQKNANRAVYTPSPYFSGGNSTFAYRA